MTWEELYSASEEEKIAELIGMGIEYADEYSQVDLEPFRNIYKKILFGSWHYTRQLVFRNL